MLLKDRTFVLIDTETTGLNKEKNQLLEIGMLVIKDLKVIDELEVKIKHKEYTISSGAMKANKIDLVLHEEEACDTKEACDKIVDFLKEYVDTVDDKLQTLIPIGQNIDFDLGFLEELFLKAYKIKDYRQVIGYRKLDIIQVALTKNMEGKLDLEKLDLDTLLNALNIEMPENRHRAITDCYLELEVLKKLIEL